MVVNIANTIYVCFSEAVEIMKYNMATVNTATNSNILKIHTTLAFVWLIVESSGDKTQDGLFCNKTSH
jgi:hypothetical protein